MDINCLNFVSKQNLRGGNSFVIFISPVPLLLHYDLYYNTLQQPFVRFLPVFADYFFQFPPG